MDGFDGDIDGGQWLTDCCASASSGQHKPCQMTFIIESGGDQGGDGGQQVLPMAVLSYISESEFGASCIINCSSARHPSAYGP